MLCLPAASLAQGIGEAASAAKFPHHLEYLGTRNGEKVGRCVFQFERSSERLEVRIDVELTVRILSIPVYRWAHHTIELWAGDRLVKMTADTNDDGVRRHVEATTDKNGSITLTVDGKTTSVAPDAVPASFWNPAVLTAKTVIDAVTGDVVHPIVRRIDTGTMGPPPNASEGERFLLTSDGALKQEMWFEANNRLVQFAAFAPDGSAIIYRITADH